MNIDAKDIKNTIMNFIVPIGSLLISIVLVLAIILPQINGWEQVQSDLNAAKTLEAQLSTKKGVLDKMIDFQSVVAEDLKVFSQTLAEEPFVPELLTQIDIIAKEAGLEVSRLSYSVTDVGSSSEDLEVTYKAVIVNLGTVGTYDEISSFLSTLENAARMIEVVSYRFSGENLEDSSVYAGTFVLRAPYLKVAPQAITDAPITIDVSNPDFINILNKVKSLRYYDISVDSRFLEVHESAPQDVENIEVANESTPEIIVQ